MKPSVTTVKELIEMLGALPPGLPVFVSGYENGYERFYAPKVTRLVQYPENPYYDGEYQSSENNSGQDGTEAVVLERVLRDE